MLKLRNRLKGVKGSCYLTHGSDDYDHRGLKKALRAISRDLINEALNDTDEHKDTPNPTSYRLVITTQVYENYGYRWKAKGGNEYHIPLTDITTVNAKTLQALVNEHRHLIERTGDDDTLHSSTEYIIDWRIYGNTELTYEEEMESDEYMSIPQETATRWKEHRENGWRTQG